MGLFYFFVNATVFNDKSAERGAGGKDCLKLHPLQKTSLTVPLMILMLPI